MDGCRTVVRLLSHSVYHKSFQLRLSSSYREADSCSAMQHAPDHPISNNAYLRWHMLYAVRKRRRTQVRLTMHDAGTRERLRAKRTNGATSLKHQPIIACEGTLASDTQKGKRSQLTLPIVCTACTAQFILPWSHTSEAARLIAY